MPLYFTHNRTVDHIALLHEVTEQTMEQTMERSIGRDWEQRYDALDLTRIHQQAITAQPAHGTFMEDGMDIAFWCGERQLDEEQSDVGIYHTTEDGGIAFRPLVRHLNHEGSALLARLLALDLGGDFARIQAMAVQIESYRPADRDLFFAEVRQRLDDRPLSEHSLMDHAFSDYAWAEPSLSDRSWSDRSLSERLRTDHSPSMGHDAMSDRGIDF